MQSSAAELERIVNQYKEMVWRTALSSLKNRSDAEDVFQDVFVQLVRHIGDIENEQHLKAWLLKVTVNRCRSFSKTVWKTRVQSYDKLREAAGDVVEPSTEDEYRLSDEDAEGFDPSTAETERGEQVMTALAGLKKDYRIIIHLFYYECLSVKMISKILGLQENAVKTRLSRARDLIRRSIK